MMPKVTVDFRTAQTLEEAYQAGYETARAEIAIVVDHEKQDMIARAMLAVGVPEAQVRKAVPDAPLWEEYERIMSLDAAEEECRSMGKLGCWHCTFADRCSVKDQQDIRNHGMWCDPVDPRDYIV